MSLIANSNLRDYSYIRRINGRIRLKERRSTCVENRHWRTEFIKKVTQGLRKKLKNCEEFVARRQIESDN